MQDPGVVEEHVDRAGRAGEGLDRSRLGLVEGVAFRAAELGRERFEPLPVPVGEHHGRTVRVERPRHPAAEPARRAGHEDPSPGEVEVLRFDAGHHEVPAGPWVSRCFTMRGQRPR